MLVNLDSYLNTHASAVKIRAERAGLLANNLANSDTPHFKARDISFKDAMSAATNSIGMSASGVSLKKGHAGHLGPTGDMRTDLLYRVPTQYSLDGNTVQADVEKAQFSENAVRYEASLQFLNGKISGLMKALRGE